MTSTELSAPQRPPASRDQRTVTPGPSLRPTRIVLSGIKPTGSLTLGNYLGALRRFAEPAPPGTLSLFPIVDLHALTVPHDPPRLRALSRESALLYLATGIDPSQAVVFRQSQVAAHTELSYLLECVAHTGELNRMIQFKEKGRSNPGSRCSLFTYPVLMAADILLYGATHVPVGDDQLQHLELTRDLVRRFNATYGDTLVVPDGVKPGVAARVMSLSDPTTKMSKEADDADPGTIRILDSPDVIATKIRRAVTDTEPGVTYDPARRPGVSNLVEILSACTGIPDAAGMRRLALTFTGSAALKASTTEAVISTLTPIHRRYDELAADTAKVDDVLALGAERAALLAAPTLRRVRTAMGLD
jgi:tryptophanyl-tRNA synthetase